MNGDRFCALCGLGLDPGVILCPSHRYVLHTGTLTAGEIVRAYAAGMYGEEGKKIDKPVIELSTGDAFLLVPGAFRGMSSIEWALLGAAREALARLFLKLAEVGREKGADPGSVALVFRAALAAQTRALAPREPPPDAG